MLITEHTTVTFYLPQEGEAMQSFVLNHEMHEWLRYKGDGCVTYVRSTVNTETWVDHSNRWSSPCATKERKI